MENLLLYFILSLWAAVVSASFEGDSEDWLAESVIQGSRENTYEINNKLWLQVPILLDDLMDRTLSYIIALLHNKSVLDSKEKKPVFNLVDRWLPRCLEVLTQGSKSPFSVIFSTWPETLSLEKNRHFVLLFAGTGSVLNSIEWEVANSSQIFNIIWRPCLEGESRVTSSA